MVLLLWQDMEGKNASTSCSCKTLKRHRLRCLSDKQHEKQPLKGTVYSKTLHPYPMHPMYHYDFPPVFS